MALTQEQMEKYGLSLSDATSSNHDKGIVAYGDNFYEINDFERQQKDGLDTDQGATFDSDLYADAKKNGYKVSNFNTATDIEGALEALGTPEESSEPAPAPDPGPVEYSPHLQEAMDRVKQWETERWNGTHSANIYGPESYTPLDERTPAERAMGVPKSPKSITEGRFDDNNRQQQEAAQLLSQDFIDKIKRNSAEMLANANQV